MIGHVVRVTYDRTTIDLATLARHSQVYRHILKPQNQNHGPTAVIHLRPTPDWLVMLCDRLATNPRPRHDRLELLIWLSKNVHQIKNSRMSCDRFTIVPNNIRGHRVIYDQPAKTCDQRRTQLAVGSLASEIDKFHDRFWRLKAVAELIDFNGK